MKRLSFVENLNLQKNFSFLKFRKNFMSTMTKEDLVARIHKHNINTVTMGFPDLYGKFIGKKYDSEYFVDKALKNGSNACNYLLSCDMGNNPLPQTQLASYERGFGDFTMKADLNSVKEINYVGENRQLVLFSDLYEQDSDILVTHAPRYLLRKSVGDLKALGYTIQFECDVNFTVFYEKYKKLSETFSNIHPITEHNNQYHALYKQNFEEFFTKLRNSLKFSGIHVDQITGDKAPGQYRCSLSLSDAVEFCDDLSIFKLLTKKLADDSDKTITYMAKVKEEWPGNNLNLKLVIKDKDGKNIFENVSFNEETNSIQFSNTYSENALSGIVRYLPDFLIFHAPTVNSYKRLKESNINDNWNKVGFQRSDCGVNLIEEGKIKKVHFNIAGSDVNQYLSLFGVINSIKLGLENKHTLEDSLKCVKDNKLPINLYDSLLQYEKSETMRNVLGKVIHEHLGVFYGFEYADFMNQVDEWELNRYLFNI